MQRSKAMIKTYRKKPVEIQALQWTGENFDECANFVGDKLTKTILKIDDVVRYIY